MRKIHFAQIESSAPFIETETLQDLRSAIASAATPVLLIGPLGSGKSTLLRIVAREWEKNGGQVSVINVYRTDGIRGVLAAVMKLLSDQGLGSKRVIESSSDSALEEALASDSSLDKTLLILDDLDHPSFSHERTLMRILRRLADRQARVVIAARPDVADTLFRSEQDVLRGASRIVVKPFSTYEVKRFLQRGGESAPYIERISALARGNPRQLNVLCLLANEMLQGLRTATQDDDDLETLAGDELSTEFLLSTVLQREVAKFGALGERLVPHLVRLSLPGSQGIRRENLPENEIEILRATIFSREEFDGTFHLADADFGPPLLAAIGIVPRGNLKSLNFGAEEAERDMLLSTQFVPPPGLAELKGGIRTIVVGDRGAGKSALYRALKEGPGDQDGEVEIFRLENSAEVILRLEVNGKALTTAEQFRAAWLLVLACTIAMHVQTTSKRQQKLAQQLREAIPNLAERDQNPTRFSPFRRALRALRQEAQGMGVKFQFGPVTLESPKAASERKGGRPIDVQEFLRETALALRSAGRRVKVAIDRIDDLHKYQREVQETLVQGLFLAESTPEHGHEVGLLIFIRTDLFEAYNIQEKNKLITRILKLDWLADSLLKLAIDRVLSNSMFESLRLAVGPRDGRDLGDSLRALFPLRVEGKAFDDWLWTSLCNGNGRVSPRQLILLLVLARDSASSDEPINKLPVFSEELLRSGMTRLSELSFSEATSDFRVAPTLLRSLRAAKKEEFTVVEVQGLFAAAEGGLASQVEMLERLGVVERLVVEDDAGALEARLRLPPLYTRCWQG